MNPCRRYSKQINLHFTFGNDTNRYFLINFNANHFHNILWNLLDITDSLAGQFDVYFFTVKSKTPHLSKIYFNIRHQIFNAWVFNETLYNLCQKYKTHF